MSVANCAHERDPLLARIIHTGLLPCSAHCNAQKKIRDIGPTVIPAVWTLVRSADPFVSRLLCHSAGQAMRHAVLTVGVVESGRPSVAPRSTRAADRRPMYGRGGWRD